MTNDNKMTSKEYQAKWRRDNPEKFKSYTKKYREKNREKLKQVQKDYYENNPEKKKEIKKKRNNYKRNNPEKMRGHHLRREYNISLEDYSKLLQEQQSRCAICEIHTTDIGRANLDVDHCHSTGKIRGLLCPNCNKALGLLKDNIEIVNSMMKYLLKVHTQI